MSCSLAQLLHPLAVGAARLEAGAIAEDEDVGPLEPWLHALDAIRLDDERSVDADEPGGREPALELGERLAQEVAILADVQPRVVAVHVDPVDVLDPDEDRALARSNREPIRRSRRRQTLEEGRHL